MADLNPQIVITAKDEASKVFKQVGEESKNLGQQIGQKLKDNVGGITAAFGLATGAVLTSIGAFQESQDTLAQLDAVLRSTKGAAGVTREEIIKLSASLQQQSKFGDEAILSAENMLLTFTSIGKDVFPQATETVLNMSQALGQDLKSSSIQLGKALNDPISGVTALRRVGVQFNDQQQEQIKLMVESGNLLGAQKMVLGELATEFGGSAKAAAETFSGQIEILKNNLNDTQEILGEGMVEALTQFTGGIDGANSAVLKLNEFLTAHKDLVMGVATALILLVAAFGILLVAALAAMAGISLAFAALVAGIVAAVGFLLGVFIYHFNAIKNNWDVIIKYLGDQFTAFGQLWKQRMQEIDNDFTAKTNHMGQQFQAMGQLWQMRMKEFDNNFRNTLDNLRNAFSNFLGWLGGLINNFRPNIHIGIDLPDIEGAWRSLKDRAHKLGIPGFATGGIVPGPIGAPQLALVHGGEEVVPHRGGREGNGGGGSVNFNVTVGMFAGSAIEKRRIAEELYKALVVYAGTQNKTVSQMLGG